MTKHTEDNCIFCKLANGQIPTNSIYEDENFNVILDAAPAAKGHAIILPKTHAANIFELPDEWGEKIFSVAKKCGNAIVKAYDYDGINILQNNGEAAGQTVFHLHVHLIPRKTDDNITIKWVEGAPDTDAEDATAVVEKIKKEL